MNVSGYKVILAGKKLLAKFVKANPRAKGGTDSWELEVKKAAWATPHDLLARFPKASLLTKGRVAFDIRGNEFRILTKVDYQNGIVLVKEAGTHKEYDKWDTR